MILSLKCFPTNSFTCEKFLTPPLNVLKNVAKAGDVRRVRVSLFRFGRHLKGAVHYKSSLEILLVYILSERPLNAQPRRYLGYIFSV